MPARTMRGFEVQFAVHTNNGSRSREWEEWADGEWQWQTAPEKLMINSANLHIVIIR